MDRGRIGFFKRYRADGSTSYHWITNQYDKTIGREESFSKLLDILNGHLKSKIRPTKTIYREDVPVPLYDVWFGATKSAGKFDENERRNIIELVQRYNGRALAFLALKGDLGEFTSPEAVFGEAPEITDGEAVKKFRDNF